MTDFTKRRLLKVWQKRREEVEKEIIKRRIQGDREFAPILRRLWLEIGPLWEEAFRAEHPDKVYHHRNLKEWIEANEKAARNRGDTREALAWVQMYNFFISMLQLKLIPRDPEEPIQTKKVHPL